MATILSRLIVSPKALKEREKLSIFCLVWVTKLQSLVHRRSRTRDWNVLDLAEKRRTLNSLLVLQYRIYTLGDSS